MNDFKPRDFFFIDKMIAPKIITVLYWFSVAACVVSGFMMLFNGNAAQGLVIIIIGPVAARLYSELLIVIFKIYEKLSKIADKAE